MDKRQKEQLVRLGGGHIRFDCPMAPYTTFHVGGPVEALYEAKALTDLQQVTGYLRKEGITYVVVGKGSNVLVTEEGYGGVVIQLRGSLATIEQRGADEETILAGGGLPISDLLSYCRSAGLGGLEFLAGIPGTVGGAIAMNAGAFRKEVGVHVKEIHMITPRGDVVKRKGPQLYFSYRQLEMEEGSVIIQACLSVNMEGEKSVAVRIAEYLKRRKESQPLEYPSAGSVFKNPPNEYAGKLIEKVGLKGKKIGGAMISEKHANFIVNTGGARAQDVLALLSLAQEKVKKETGIELEPEIQIVGT